MNVNRLTQMVRHRMGLAMAGDPMGVLPSLVRRCCTCFPKRLRAKIDMRWRVGIFLGTAERTNEAFVGTVSGSVVKSRAITRVVHASK